MPTYGGAGGVGGAGGGEGEAIGSIGGVWRGWTAHRGGRQSGGRMGFLGWVRWRLERVVARLRYENSDSAAHPALNYTRVPECLVYLFIRSLAEDGSKLALVDIILIAVRKIGKIIASKFYVAGISSACHAGGAHERHGRGVEVAVGLME